MDLRNEAVVVRISVFPSTKQDTRVGLPAADVAILSKNTGRFTSLPTKRWLHANDSDDAAIHSRSVNYANMLTTFKRIHTSAKCNPVKGKCNSWPGHPKALISFEIIYENF
uniref:Uncharacterized protein n=1 Tax=Glossina austeni TaxID=7395 RepID=A0A1A9UFJ8_GLOAU